MKLRLPHTFVLLFVLIALAAVATHVVPAGEYARVDAGGRSVVDPGSYAAVATRPAGVSDVLLAFPLGWGGKREGAGRKPKGAKAGVPHRKKGPLSRRHAVHVTMRLRDGLPSLRRWREYEVLLGAFRSGCERFGFRLVHYAVLGNHVHLLTEGENRRGHARGVAGLAIRIAKRLNKLWGRQGKVFHERFHGRKVAIRRRLRERRLARDGLHRRRCWFSSQSVRRGVQQPLAIAARITAAARLFRQNVLPPHEPVADCRIGRRIIGMRRFRSMRGRWIAGGCPTCPRR